MEIIRKDIVPFVYGFEWEENKRQRIPQGQSKMDNPEKLVTKGT